MPYDKDTVKQAAANQWLSIITSLCGVDASVFNQRAQDCPKCGGSGSNDRFRAFDDFAETGGVVCNRCGKMGDGFKTIEWLNDCDFKTALEQVAKFLSVKSVTQKPRNGTRTSRRSPKQRKNQRPSSTRKRKPSKNAKYLKPTKWNVNVARIFCRKHRDFLSAETLEAMGAICAIYLSELVIGLPINDCQGEANDNPTGYTIFPVMKDGIPYRGKRVPKQTIML